MDEFYMQLAVCAAAAAIALLSGSAAPLFALSLFAVSQAGYFTLLQFRKGGMGKLAPPALLIVAAFACYFLAGFYFGAINTLAALVFLPSMFVLPSAVAAAREVFLSG